MAITKFGSCLFFPFIFSFLSSLSLSLLFLPCLELPKPKLYAPLFWFSSYHPCLNVWFHAMNFVIRLSWIKLVNNLGQTNGQKSLIFSWWPATSLMSSNQKFAFVIRFGCFVYCYFACSMNMKYIHMVKCENLWESGTSHQHWHCPSNRRETLIRPKILTHRNSVENIEIKECAPQHKVIRIYTCAMSCMRFGYMLNIYLHCHKNLSFVN